MPKSEIVRNELTSHERVRNEVHVISHTHWDREWYRPFELFRFRLVQVVDQLIDTLNADPNYRFFMLDGQTVVLEDYLEIRPEREADLDRLIRAGRLLVGPWYILPDEFLVSGEATVRNMLIGCKVARRFGEPMLVGYIPDTFGHLAQMPQILRGFGIDTAIFWRGLSGPAEEVKSEFRWQAPDGSEVLAIHLVDDMGYSSWADMPSSVEPGVASAREKLALIRPHATTQYLLLMNGTDHQPANPVLPAILAAASAELDADFVHSTLPAYLEKVKASVRDLDVLRQEFRDTNRKPGTRFNFILAAVLSTRMYLKTANQACETELEKWTEPFGAIAWKLGAPYPGGFIEYAWKQLLRNHPHDSICGCSVDEVHTEMETRFHKVLQISNETTDLSLGNIARHIPAGPQADGEGALVVFNPLGWARDDVVSAKVHSYEPMIRGVEVRDSAGQKLPARVVGFEPVSPLPPYNGRGDMVEICFAVKGLPALGYGTFSYRLLGRPDHQRSDLKVGPRGAENEYLALSIRDDGSLTITDKATGHNYEGGNVFEDGGDSGDEYVYGPPVQDRIISSVGQIHNIALVDDGPARASFLVEFDLQLPESEAGPDGRARSAKLVSNPVKSLITLGAHARRIDIETTVENHSKDHRLRVLFTSGVRPAISFAETAFDVVNRPVRAKQPGSEWIEDAPNFHPQATFVDANDGGHGLAIANRGLPEYEIKPDGTIAITLVRSVGWLGRTSSGIQTGAGPHLRTPGGQCQRTLTLNYSMIPHAGDWLEGRAHQQAYQHAAPPRAILATSQSLSAADALPLTRSFLDLGSDALILSAVKQSTDGKALIVRVFNPADRPVRAVVRPGFEYQQVSVANLAEVAERELPRGVEATVAVDVPAHGILTLRFE